MQAHNNKKFRINHNLLFVLTFCICNSCAIQYGIYNIKDASVKDAMENKGYLALDLFTPPFLGEKVDVNIGVGFLKGQEYGKGQLKTHLNLSDLNSTMHYYPLGAYNDAIFVRPYIGAGVGYFDLRLADEIKGDRVGGITLPNSHWSYYEIDYESHSLVKGFYPNIVFGISIPLGLFEEFGFVIENRINIKKSNNGLDFSGNILLFGVRWNPWY